LKKLKIKKIINRMKRILIVTLVLLVSIEIQSTTIPLDSIRRSLASFLSKVDHLNYSTDYLSDFLIIDRGKQEPINEGKDGVFTFRILHSGARTHFLLVDHNSFQILNMTEPIEINVQKLLTSPMRHPKRF